MSSGSDGLLSFWLIETDDDLGALAMLEGHGALTRISYE